MVKYLLGILGLFMLVTSCVDATHDRLQSSGKTVSVPQSKAFCRENKDSTLCSK